MSDTVDTASMIAFLKKLAGSLGSAKLETVADRLEEQDSQIKALEERIAQIATLCSQS
ncbi:MAG: hypothetical protein JSS66_07450 [Armatimonadetes bacterium]|nr:hypothetical protein [Armatimonadota bacterium]